MHPLSWIHRRIIHRCLDVASSKVVLAAVHRMTHVKARRDLKRAESKFAKNNESKLT